MKSVFVVTTVLALMNLYVAVSFRHRLAGLSGAAALLAVVFLGFYALQLVIPLFDLPMALFNAEIFGEEYESLARAAFFALGVLSLLFVYTAVADVAGLLVKLVAPTVAASRSFHPALLALVLVATLGSVLAGLPNAGRVEVKRVDMPLKDLPAGLEGMTIVQLSDIHVGAFLKRDFVQTIVDKVNELKPDIVVLTGDIADGTALARGEELTPFAELKPTYGKYYVTGNHEYYWDVRGWASRMQQLGFRVLTNEHVVLQKGGERLILAGVPDPTSAQMELTAVTDPAQAITGAPAGAASLLLSHRPSVFEAAQRAGFTAQLSGHTHAGQYFPFTMMIGLVQPQHSGMYVYDNFKLYVNKGAGFWGPPLRTGGAGEITLLTLKRE